jgi:hypothetical protein
VLCCAVLCCAVLCCAVLCCQADYGLFTACEGSGALYPSPTAERLPQGLALLEFIGGWHAGVWLVWCECVSDMVSCPCVLWQLHTCLCGFEVV